MSTNLYEITVASFTRGLNNLQKWMDKAQAHADAKKFEVDTLVTARLAPDMYPFVKQVQIACDTAKFAAVRLTEKEAPKHEDNEKTFAELRQRINKALAYLATFKPADFNGAEDRRVPLPWAPGKWMHGGEYVPQMAGPNFYFHLTTAYDILRHNGVDVGKMDFIGDVNIKG
jgi:hypothetical protein